jgi:Flp pilus assembly protein TadD
MLGDVGGAQSAFERAMSVDRNFGETHGGLAVVAALQSREEDARQLVRRALRLDPKSLAARYAEMLLMQRQGRDAEAKAVLDSILSRPAGRGGLQYRELVVAQLQALRARAEDSAPPVVIH